MRWIPNWQSKRMNGMNAKHICKGENCCRENCCLSEGFNIAIHDALEQNDHPGRNMLKTIK